MPLDAKALGVGGAHSGNQGGDVITRFLAKQFLGGVQAMEEIEIRALRLPCAQDGDELFACIVEIELHNADNAWSGG